MPKPKLTTNIKRVKKSALDTQSRYTLNTRALARQVGREVRDSIRANITPRGIGTGGLFEGYAMTSTLWKHVVASAAKKATRAWTVRVRVLMTGRVKLYALIHEVGGIIRAKNKPFLVFKIKGHWVRVKQVRIRRKEYFKKGVARVRKSATLGSLASKLWSGS